MGDKNQTNHSREAMRRPGLSDVPRGVLWLGGTGLIPFAVPAVVVWLGHAQFSEIALFAQLIYAAVIMSFLGGVHWGLGIAEYGAPRRDDSALMVRRLAWSVVPSLVAWLALYIAIAGQVVEGLVLFILLTVAVFWGDLAAWRRGLEPPWYIVLRRHLTAGVVVCLGSSLMRIMTA